MRIQNFARVVFVVCLGMMLAGCGVSPDRGDARVIRVWAHQGQEAENRAMRDIVDAFNAAHEDEGIVADITFFPDHQYGERVSAGAAAGDLPDVLDLDGPTVARMVDTGLLAPLDPWFSEAELADFLPTILEQGTIGDTLYALGAFDSALVLYYDKDMFETAGVTPPAVGGAWTWEEFFEACARLKAAGIDPVSLHMDETADEWYTYAFSPLVWSAGGALMDTETNAVEGVLNAETNIRVFEEWQKLFTEDYADNAPVDPDPFGSGNTAMDWSGHWVARSHIANKGARLGVMPLPRTGDSPVAASGSWAWAVTSTARDPALAARFLRWVVSAEHGVTPIVRANGAVPARFSAYEAFPEYEAPPYSLFKALLTGHGRSRPRTPHYPVLTRNFAAAVRDIARGTDPASALNRAAAQTQAVVDR